MPFGVVAAALLEEAHPLKLQITSANGRRHISLTRPCLLRNSSKPKIPPSERNAIAILARPPSSSEAGVTLVVIVIVERKTAVPVGVTDVGLKLHVV